MKLVNIEYGIELYILCDVSKRILNRTLIFEKKTRNLYPSINIPNLITGSYMIELKLNVKSKYCGNLCPHLEESLDLNRQNKFQCINCKNLVSFFKVSSTNEGAKCLKHAIMETVESFFEASKKSVSDSSIILDSELQNSIRKGTCHNISFNFIPVQEPLKLKSIVFIVFILVLTLLILINFIIIFKRIKNIGILRVFINNISKNY